MEIRIVPAKKNAVVLTQLLLCLTLLLLSLNSWSQIAQRGTATSAISTNASLTINKPAGIVSGDILIANIGNYLSGGQTSASSAGWTLIAGTDIDRGRASLLYKIAGASEPASYTFTVTTGSTASSGAIVAFSGVNTTTPFDVTPANTWYTATSTSLSNIPSITTVTNNAAVLIFGNCSRVTTQTNANFLNANWQMTAPATLTELYDVGHNNLATTACVGAAWAIKPTAGATGLGKLNCNVNTGTIRILAGTAIALRPCSSTANAGSAMVAICRGGTSAALGGSVGGGATGGTWSDGGVGGTFSPNATTLNATYTPPAAYTGTVTLTLTSSGGACGVSTASKTLTVTSPSSASIVYSAASFCNSILTAQAVTLTGTAGGTFTSSPAGLSINNTTGAITPSSSTVGSYTVSYTLPAAGGCNAVVANAAVQILNDQNTISYPQLSYCNNFSGAVAVTRNAPAGGTYSAVPAGLSIDPTTGAVNIDTSTPGTYTVTYNFSGGSCSNSVSTSLTVKPMPVVSCPANTGTCLNAPSFALSGGSPFGGTYSGTGVSGGNFNPATASLGTFPITYSYTSNGCTSTCNFNMTVTSSSIAASATPASNFVYSGNPAIINMTSSVPGTQYTWTVTSNNPAVSGYSNQTTPSTGPINQVINNPSTTVSQLTYVITPRLIGCTGTPMTVVISLPSTTFCESPGTFQAGSCIINMGVTPQTYNNGLKPYGLLYQLLNVNKVPVYWAINPNKTFENPTAKVDQADFTVDGITFKGGSFIVPAGYLSQVQSVINSWVAQGVVVHYTTTSFDPPVYELLTHIPRVVLDINTGNLIEAGFYTKAGIPLAAYTKGGIPSVITNCDDVYVLPHADPASWSQAQKDSLLNFINQRGWLFTSCYAVSQIENLSGMNFLSNGGLVPYASHAHPPTGGAFGYSLGAGLDAASFASDPFMQFVGKFDGAVNTYALERIYVPKPAGWRTSTKIASYFPNYVNSGITYPNTAAELVYGRAFGDNNKGIVMYLAGHDFERGNVEENVAMARVYASFLLRSGAGTRPIINPVSIPASALSGQTVTLSVSIPPSTSAIVTTEWTSDLNGIFSSQGTTTTFTAPTVDVPTVCTVQFKAVDACGRSALYCTTILINPTISNNYIGNSQTICSGSTPSVLNGSVPFYSAGNNFSYQWLMSTTSASAGFSAAPGINNQQNYAPGALTQTTWFRREVTAYGITVFSSSIEITVSNGPVISTQPSSVSQSVCGGGSFTGINVATAESPVTYQWYSNTTGSNTGGTLVSGASSSALTPPANTATGLSVYYFCAITNAQGCSTSSSVSGSFTVTQPPIITTNISNTPQTICLGESMTPLSVTVSTTPTAYRWFYNVNPTNTGGTQITTINATSNIGTFTPSVVGSYYYYCWVLPPSGCGAVIRSQVSGLITIKQTPSLSLTNNTGANAITCNIPNISITANSDPDVTYSWSDGLGNLPTATITDSGSYNITVTGSNGCNTTSNINIGWGIVGSTWTGVHDAEWDDEENWCGGVPTDTSDVTIPAGTPNDPVISSSHDEAQVRNLNVEPGANIYLDDQKIKLHGSLTGTGLINAVNGKIELKGTAVQQTISGSQFEAHTIRELKISNPQGVLLAGNNDTLKITGVVEFGNSNCTLDANGNLTLVSNINGTARVADLTSGGNYTGNKIIGNVTVERYVPNHAKAWQLLAAPTSGQSIKSSWQEGNAPLSSSLNPGYGTIITSNFGGSTAGAQALGFDIYTPAGGTMKTYQPATDTWISVPNTTGPIANSKGYMLLVRGDRSVTAYNQAATATTLRTSGLLYQPAINLPAITNVTANKFESVANPYASAIDVSKITRTGGVQDVYYVWDPKLTNTGISLFGLGAWQTIVKVGNAYTVVPGGGSYANGNVNIESGQAFLVRAVDTDGSVSFDENCKTAGSNMFTRSIESYSLLSAKLFAKSPTDTVLLDGALSLFDAAFSNDITKEDAVKMLSGNAESISILKGSRKLVAEQRGALNTNDTVYYALSGLRRQSYQLQLNYHEFFNAGMTATLIDNYLHTAQLINVQDQNSYDFTVTTDPGSYQAGRFMVVFKKAAGPVVKFTTFKAHASGNQNNHISWSVNLNEQVAYYELEKSEDGINFIRMKAVPSQAAQSGILYNTTDEVNHDNTVYYRIKAVLINSGGLVYSSTGKVSSPKILVGKVNVYPNPVENKQMHIRFANITPGSYVFKLIDEAGKTISLKKVTLTQMSEAVDWAIGSKTPSGNYTLSVFLNEEMNWNLPIIIK